MRIAIPGNAESTLRVYQGQSVLIQSVAVNIPEGITVLSYQWTFMSQAVSHLSLQGSRNASLSISNLSYLEHLGDYQCTMTLSTGEQYNSNIISLTASKSIDMLSYLVATTWFVFRVCGHISC